MSTSSLTWNSTHQNTHKLWPLSIFPSLCYRGAFDVSILSRVMVGEIPLPEVGVVLSFRLQLVSPGVKPTCRDSISGNKHGKYCMKVGAHAQVHCHILQSHNEWISVPVFKAAPAGVLPFCLCRKPLVEPGAVGESIRPGHMKNRMVQPIKNRFVVNYRVKEMSKHLKDRFTCCFCLKTVYPCPYVH